MRAFALAATASVALWSAPSAAHHVNAFAVIDKAFASYKATNDYGEARAIFSEALRQGPHEGKLDQEFGILFAVYSDIVRFDGNPSFGLLLAEEGLALVNSAAEPDLEMRNALTISRAYALADLGRYEEAVEAATIAALWLEERFGQDARVGLEAEVRVWAERQGDNAGDLPSAATIALDLLGDAEQAMLRDDTGLAIELASRAMLPEASSLSEAARRLVNGWSRSITGAAYAVEGRHGAAVSALLEAVDLIASQPWSGQGKVALFPGIETDLTPRVAWQLFVRLASSAVFIEEFALADAALENGAVYANTPQARFSLLVQRANVLMRSDNHAAVEALLRESEAEAAAIGDMANVSLARFYLEVVRMQREERTPDAPEVVAMLEAARAAADAASDNLPQVEYILANATRLAVSHALAYQAALPVAREGFAAFLRRQSALGGYEQGQDSARRERRRFLETYIDTLFETDTR